jgi:hypothetical protein
MSRCLQVLIGFGLLAISPAAMAEDAYYRLPLDRLELTEGGLPKAGGETDWRYWQRRDFMQACAVLDGEGEAYVRYQQRPSWEGPMPRSGRGEGDSDAITVRAPAGRDVTGRIYLPNQDLKGMTVARFKIPAAAAKPEAKWAFLELKLARYEQLVNRDIPGGAWFRHQLRETQKAMSRQPGDVGGPARQPRQNWGRTRDLSDTFELFSGGRAMSENLQLDRVLPATKPDEETVPVSTIEGITVQEIDWKDLIEGKSPKLDPLSKKIPADQHVIFFPTFTAALDMSDQTKEAGDLIFQMAEPRSIDSQVFPRYQKQLCLTVSGIARLLGPKVARSVAMTGSDSYFPTGTDVAVLFEAPDPTVLEQMILAQVSMKVQHHKQAKPIKGEVAGVAYRGYRSADREICCYVARMEGVVVVTNSPYQLQRLAAVAEGKAKPIASLDEYVFFRSRCPLGGEGETAFLFLSDATIRRWCGPQWRIATSRRTRDAAVMAEIQAAQLDRLVEGKVEAGPIYTDLPIAAEGKLTLTPAGVASSNLGTLDFMTPIGELPLDRVTKAEADAYSRWRQGYQRNWSWAFDPIAASLAVNNKRLAADLTVMPLILGTEYRQFAEITRGTKMAPDACDPHDALGQFVVAINKDSQPVRSAGDFARMMAGGVRITDPLGWLGDSVSIYVDDDPFWADLAQLKPGDRDKFMQKNYWRIPVALHAQVSSGLKLTAFLAAARAFIDQTGPGMTHWESLSYKDQPYVKVTPTERARGREEDLKNVAIYYTASGDSLVVTPNERMLKRSIDRQLAREEAKKKGAKPAAPERSWLGESVALHVDRRLLEAVAVLGSREYQVAMQQRSWSNLPILNEWRQRYPNEDAVKLHARFWQTELVCPGGGKYVWNEKWQTMESTVYGHPGEPKEGPAAPPILERLKNGSFGLTFENQGLRAKVSLER